MKLTDATVAANQYFDLLLREEAETTRTLLSQAIADRNLVFRGKAICDRLRPFFIEHERYERLLAITTTVAAALTKVTRCLALDRDFRRVLGLSEQEESLLRAIPGEPQELLGRIDGFFGDDGVIRFIEYNPMGGGAVDCEELSEAFLAMPIMKRFQQRFACALVPTRNRMLEAFLYLHAKRGAARPPSIAVLKPSAVDQEPTDSLLSASVLDDPETLKSFSMAQAAGCSLRFVEPTELSFDGRDLRAPDGVVDTLIAANWPRLVREIGADAPLWRAVRGGAAWILNSPANDVLRANKKTFAILSDPAYGTRFSSEEGEALARHIPWTRIVREGKTTYRHETVDLLPFIITHRERLVLKPSDGFGGKGVTLGWLSDDRTWEAALQNAARKEFVVQERVQTPTDDYPAVVDGELSFQKCFVDLNPFVWRGTVAAGCMVRVSPTAVLNQSAGSGSNVPFLLLGQPDSNS